MVSLLPVCLSKGRIKGTDEIAEVHCRTTLGRLFPGAREQPRVLCAIPKQCCLTMLLLIFFTGNRSTKGTYDLPLWTSIARGTIEWILQIIIKQSQPVSLVNW
jgi:hypothetical protein